LKRMLNCLGIYKRFAVKGTFYVPINAIEYN
jgi:hypothetical protein